MQYPNIVNVFKETENLSHKEAITLLREFPDNDLLVLFKGPAKGYIVPINILEAGENDLAAAQEELEAAFLIQPFEEAALTENGLNEYNLRQAYKGKSNSKALGIVAGVG